MTQQIEEINKKIEKAFNYANSHELDISIKLINEVVDELSHIEDLKWNIPYLRMFIVFAEAQNAQIRNAFQIINLAIEELESKEDENIASLYSELRQWIPKLDITVAVDLLQFFRARCSEHNWMYTNGLIYLTEGVLFANQNNLLEAKTRFTQAHESLLHTEAYTDIAIALRNLTQANYDLGLLAQSHLILLQLSDLLIERKEAFQREDYDIFENLCWNVGADSILVSTMFKNFDLATNEEDRSQWLHKVLKILSKFNNIFESLIFEQTVVSLLHSLAHPIKNAFRKEILYSSIMLSNYEMLLGMSAPFVTNNMRYSSEYLSIFRIYLQQSFVHSRANLNEPNAVHELLLQMAILDNKRQNILQESLNKRWRLSERTERLDRLSFEFNTLVEKAESATEIDISNAPIFQEWNRQQFIDDTILELYVTYSHYDRTLIVAMNAVNGDIRFFYRKLPNQVLNSVYSVLDNYPEYEMNFLSEFFSSLCLPESLLEKLSRSKQEHLLIVGDNFIQRIPWESIKLEKQYIGLKFAVSRTMLVPMRRRNLSNRGKNALIIANPTQDLPEAEAEGVKIAEKLRKAGYKVELLQTATSSDLISAQEIDILHFAGHASFIQEYPLASYLRLHDRPVTLDEIAKLNNMEGCLVVLNACETATTSYSKKMGTQSFIQSFLDAKAATVIGGLWPVVDGAASELMIEFYSSLMEGKTVSEALRKARNALKQQGKGLKDWGSHAIFGDTDWLMMQPVILTVNTI